MKNNLSLMFLSILSILLSLFNQIQVAQYFGVSSQRDTYFIANTLVSMLITVHYRSIVLFFLPKNITYIKQSKQGLGSAFIWIHIVLISMFALFLILSVYILKIFGILPFPNISLLFQLLLLLLICFIFQSTNNLISIVYNNQKKFLLPASQNALTTAFVIFFIYAFYNNGIIVLAFGNLLAYSFSFIFLFIGAYEKLTIKINLKSDIIASINFIKEVSPFILVAIITMMVHILEPFFVERYLKGVISYLGYSYQIILILITLISSSIITTFFPKISNLYIKGDTQSAHKSLLKTMQIIFIFCISISGFILFYGKEIISLVFERGHFKPGNSLSIYNVLRWELPVFIFGSLSLLLNRIFYLNKNIKALFVTAILSLITYIVSAFILYIYFKQEGLGMALSIWATIYFLGLFFSVISSIGVKLKNIFLFFVNVLIIIFSNLLIIWLLDNYLNWTNNILKLSFNGFFYSVIPLILLWRYTIKN